eukprot:7424309-Prorocentrum_lima.AAC.1
MEQDLIELRNVIVVQRHRYNHKLYQYMQARLTIQPIRVEFSSLDLLHRHIQQNELVLLDHMVLMDQCYM